MLSLPTLNDDEEALFEELSLTAIESLDDAPVPSLIRAFAWLEERRRAKEWKLFEIGLLFVRGQLRRRNPRDPLVKDLLRYLEERGCRFLDGIDQRPRIPKSKWATPPTKPLLRRWAREEKARKAKDARDARQKAALLRRSFARGEAVKLFPVIAFRKAGGGMFVTVWGLKSASGQWPTPQDVQTARRAVWRANQPETQRKNARRAERERRG